MDTQTLRRDILKRAIRVSTNLREYFLEQYSFTDFEGANDTDITDRYNVAMEFIYNELAEMGVSIADGVDTVMDNSMIIAALSVREYFDTIGFNALLSVSPQHREAIYDLLSSESYIEEEFITELLEVMYDLNPIGVKIEIMYNNRLMFISSDRFIDHVNSILVNVIPSSSGTVIDKYTTAIVDHEAKVKAFAIALASHVDVNVDLKYDFNNYDIDLTSLAKHEMELYLDTKHPAQIEGDDTESVRNHKRNHRHHFEYFKLNNGVIPTDSDIVVLIAEHFNNDLNVDAQLSYFYNMTSNSGFNDEIITKFADYIKTSYNLVGDYVH